MRLIKADKLLERMKKGMESGSNLNGTFDLYIEHAPTVKPTGDLISRQDVVSEIDEWIQMSTGNGTDMVIKDFLSFLKERIDTLPSADRPTGEVDAVAIYEKAEHDLEHGKITLGEFEKRIEPLKHLRCDRPTEWIPVSERLPKEGERVLTYDNLGDIDFGQYDKGHWYWEAEACADYWTRNDGVIAWLPLPTPYKGGEEE